MKIKNIIWYMNKNNPYEIIEDAFNTLLTGDYSGALHILENASAYVGRFFPDGSVEDNELRQNIELFRYILNNHPEEYRELMANDTDSEINFDYKHRYL